MKPILNLLVAFIAVQHLIFLVLEMFLWTKPAGLKVFRMTPEVAASSAVLAKNQGLYNGFLAAGLIWSLWADDPLAASLKIFFLVCVAVAGIFGGITAHRGIALVQGLPAAMALFLIWWIH